MENGELPMSLGEQVLLVGPYRLRTHGKREDVRSRAAEDCCLFGRVCVRVHVRVRLRVCVCMLRTQVRVRGPARALRTTPLPAPNLCQPPNNTRDDAFCTSCVCGQMETWIWC